MAFVRRLGELTWVRTVRRRVRLVPARRFWLVFRNWRPWNSNLCRTEQRRPEGIRSTHSQSVIGLFKTELIKPRGPWRTVE
jgi:hypothetical protein